MLPGVVTGAFYQCAWAGHEEAAEPQRLLTSYASLLPHVAAGLPELRVRPGLRGEHRRAYFGPLSGSCACGRAHPRRTSEAALAAETLVPGAARRLVDLLNDTGAWDASRPTALVGGEIAASTLLSGPPCRGPSVRSAAAGARKYWRPLDIYVGRNSRLGDPKWGNPFRVGRDGDAARCCRLFEEDLRKDAARLSQLGELRGRRLRCHCPPGSPCHADSLVVLFCESSSRSGPGGLGPSGSGTLLGAEFSAPAVAVDPPAPPVGARVPPKRCLVETFRAESKKRSVVPDRGLPVDHPRRPTPLPQE